MRLQRWQFIVVGAIAILIVILSGVGFVSYQEQDDNFCASCHTQPETEYLARNLQADATQDAPDLASFHHRKKNVRCIDCHVGEGFVGRTAVLSLAAWDAFKHYTGMAQQPAKIVFPIQNEACLKCHQQEVARPGFENHQHNKYDDPQLSPPFIRCTNCHVAHRLGDERTAFQFRDAILPRCEYCHQQVGKGPRGQATPMP
ncbi:MAG: NapC/NirT family cytochrome c [Chloroflexi bacterium]|nr:NapC/NirT family cytochrome c [Chloroflexota bacterium]